MFEEIASGQVVRIFDANGEMDVVATEPVKAGGGERVIAWKTAESPGIVITRQNMVQK